MKPAVIPNICFCTALLAAAAPAAHAGAEPETPRNHSWKRPDAYEPPYRLPPVKLPRPAQTETHRDNPPDWPESLVDFSQPEPITLRSILGSVVRAMTKGPIDPLRPGGERWPHAIPYTQLEPRANFRWR